MRRIVLAALAVFILFVTGTMTPQRAEAMPTLAPLAGTADTGPLQDVAYNCRPIWRCGRYGCGWRRVCYWTPGAYWAPGPYWGPRRWGWRHRHWHRW